MQGKSIPCPKGYIYVAQVGETLAGIAARSGYSLDQLLRSNPWIADPNRILPGEQICLPQLEPACCLYLTPAAETHRDAAGSVLWSRFNGRNALLFSAFRLPEPRALGEFDTYIGSLLTPSGERVSAILARQYSPSEPKEPLWIGLRIVTLTLNGAVIEIRAYNTVNDTQGPVFLRGKLEDNPCSETG